MNKETCIFLLLLVLSARLCFGQAIPDFTKLPHADSLSNRDFRPIAPYLKNKRVILAGEASHGGREFFTVKTALLKYLVEEQGFLNFALEENLAVCEKFNAYIAGNLEADAKALAKEAYYTWPYHTEEFRNLLEWMRTYNATKPQAGKIKFWGIDMQFAYGSLRLLEDRIQNIDSGINLNIPQVPRQEHFMYRAPDSTLATIDSFINGLNNSNPEKAYLERHLDAVKMKNAYTSLQREGMYPTEASSRYRDSSMAVNVTRILTHIGPEEKMMVWAHNGHVAKSFNTAVKKAPMGAFLNGLIPDILYSIGFDYNYGELLRHVSNRGFIPITIRPREDHDLARLLDKVGYNLLFIPIRATPESQNLLARPVQMRKDSALVEASYAELYDGLFFINSVRATTPLK